MLSEQNQLKFLCKTESFAVSEKKCVINMKYFGNTSLYKSDFSRC